MSDEVIPFNYDNFVRLKKEVEELRTLVIRQAQAQEKAAKQPKPQKVEDD